MTRTLNEVFGSGPGAVAESLVLAVAFAWLGYRMSVRHRAVRGVTPWRLPSVLWAVICLVLQFIGIALEILAELTTRPALPSQPPASGRPPSGDLGYLYPSATVPPAAVPTGATVPLGPVLPSDQPAPPASDQEGKPALFGWYPDPLGRHELRYFDGRRWADLVADGGEHGRDPL